MDKLSELRLAFAKMGAEIEKLEEQPRGVWKPQEGEAYYWLNSVGICVYSVWPNQSANIQHHNVYQTAKQAQKASGLTRQSNRTIQACINFDPDYVPDWGSSSIKYSVFYANTENSWIVGRNTYNCGRPTYVSSHEIAQSICDIFNAEDKL
jgi:hypothetical protein